jgi:hypothetical protein
MALFVSKGFKELVGRQLVPNVGHIDVFALIIVAENLEHKRARTWL